MSEKHISLEAEPIVETSVETIVENLKNDYVADMQKDDKIRRLSQEIRFLIDENQKNRTELKRAKMNILILTERNLQWSCDSDPENLENAFRGGGYVDQPLDMDTANAKIEAWKKRIEEAVTGSNQTIDEEKLSDIGEFNKEHKYDFVSTYFAISQSYSNFHNSTRADRVKGSPGHFMLGAVGLAEELAEADDSLASKESLTLDFENLKEEIGDVEWYVGCCCSALGFSMQELVSKAHETAFDDASIPIEIEFAKKLALSLLGHAKKVYFHEHEVNKSFVWNHLHDIQVHVQSIINQVGWTLEEVFEKNLEKGKKRYPSGKFSAEDSINRKE